MSDKNCHRACEFSGTTKKQRPSAGKCTGCGVSINLTNNGRCKSCGFNQRFHDKTRK